MPALIKACVEIVERDGLDSVGLYRISGKREDILKVQDMYDHGEYPFIHHQLPLKISPSSFTNTCLVCYPLSLFTPLIPLPSSPSLSSPPSPLPLDPNVDINTLDVCVNAITGILKTFFKVLPDPLIPEKLLTPLLDIPGTRHRH